MNRSKKVVRKVAVGFVGIPVLIVGFALLVLPGPGLLVILAGLLILSLEFEIAKKYVGVVRARLNDVGNATKKVGRGKSAASGPAAKPDQAKQTKDE